MPRGCWGSQKTFTHPSTAGERSGLLLPLDRYLRWLCWLCRRGGRPAPQWSPAPSRPPIGPPRPAGTDPPIGPPPNPPRSLRPPSRPPGSRGSESGVSLSVVNGRSSNNRCHSYGIIRIRQGRKTGKGLKKDGVSDRGREIRENNSKMMNRGWRKGEKAGGGGVKNVLKHMKWSQSIPFAHFPTAFSKYMSACTSANCVAVSSIPFAPPSRRLRKRGQKKFM